MLKIAVCNNLKEQTLYECNLINEFMQTLYCEYMLFSFASGESLLESGNIFHIAIINVFMQGKDGIETGFLLRKANPDILIIFTAFQKEALLEAVNYVHAFSYLLKPYDRRAFRRQFGDAVRLVQRRKHIKTVSFLTEGNGNVHVPTNEIYYFEYMNRKIKMVTEKRNYICIKEKIYELSDKMRQYSFEMPHQSYIVNLEQIESIRGYEIFIYDGSVIPLAQKRAAGFRRKMKSMAEKE